MAKIHNAVDEAKAAFWRVIEKRYPEATTGDLPHDVAIDLDTAMLEAVEEWVKVNVG